MLSTLSAFAPHIYHRFLIFHQKDEIKEGKILRGVNLELFSNQRRDVLLLSPKMKGFPKLIYMKFFVLTWLTSSPIHLCLLCMPVWSVVLAITPFFPHYNILFTGQYHSLDCKLIEGRICIWNLPKPVEYGRHSANIFWFFLIFAHVKYDDTDVIS